MKKVNVSSQLVIVPGGQHGAGMFVEKYITMMVDFFNKQLLKH